MIRVGVIGAGGKPLGIFLLAPLDGDDFALVEEQIGHADRLVEQSSRIVPKVEHQTLQRLAAGVEIVQGPAKVVGGVFLEVGYPDVSVAGAQGDGEASMTRFLTTAAAVALATVGAGVCVGACVAVGCANSVGVGWTRLCSQA